MLPQRKVLIREKLHLLLLTVIFLTSAIPSYTQESSKWIFGPMESDRGPYLREADSTHFICQKGESISLIDLNGKETRAPQNLRYNLRYRRENSELFKFEEDNRKGVFTVDDGIVFSSDCDQIEFLTAETFIVKKDGESALYNKDGSELFPFEKNITFHVHQDTLIFKQPLKFRAPWQLYKFNGEFIQEFPWSVIDSVGIGKRRSSKNVVLDILADQGAVFMPVQIAEDVETETSQDEQPDIPLSDLLIKHSLDKIGDFTNGRAVATRGRSYNIIDDQGNLVFDQFYGGWKRNSSYIYAARQWVQSKTGRKSQYYTLIDSLGSPVNSYIYKKLVIAGDHFIVGTHLDGTSEIYDHLGNVLPILNQRGQVYQDSFLIVGTNNGVGLLDSDYKWVFGPNLGEFKTVNKGQNIIYQERYRSTTQLWTSDFEFIYKKFDKYILNHYAIHVLQEGGDILFVNRRGILIGRYRAKKCEKTKIKGVFKLTQENGSIGLVRVFNNL